MAASAYRAATRAGWPRRMAAAHAPGRRRHALELADQLLRALRPVRRVLREAAHDQGRERRRHAGAVLGDGFGRRRHLGREQPLGGEPAERGPTRQHLVTERADGVQIRPVVHGGIAGGLLRRHVGRRAERDPQRGERRLLRGLGHRLRDSEVRHERVLPREQHVVGLHVAVHDALPVSVGERVTHVAQDPHRIADRQLVLVGQAGAQRLALDVRHDVIEQVARRAGREQRNDVGVLQPGGELDLALEPVHVHPGGHRGREHLHHHLPPQPHLRGEEDTTHAPAAELLVDAVHVPQGGLEAVFQVNHFPVLHTGRTGHSGHFGFRATQITAPSSISA